MTFTQQEIIDSHIMVNYEDEWQVNETRKTIDVLFSGFEEYIGQMFNLPTDDEDSWVNCYATIDLIEGVVVELYWLFESNSDIPDRELQISITNYPEGKALLDELVKSDMRGEFKQFIKETKEEFEKIKSK